MQKCKKCGKISVAYDPVRLEWRCLWNSCRYAVTEKAAANGEQKKTASETHSRLKSSGGGRPAIVPGG